MNRTLHIPPSLLSKLFAAAAIAGLSQSALAFQPLITDDTGTQGTGGNQLEAGLNADRKTSGGALSKTRTIPLTYTRGITDTLDLFVGVSSVRTTDAVAATFSGSGNPTVGGKWRFYENEEHKTSFGFKQEIRLPVSAAKETNGLGVGKTSYASTLILTQEMPFGAVHANLVNSRDRFANPATSPASLNRFSVAPVWDVTEQFKLALDLGTEKERANGTSTRAQTVEFGAIYSPNKDLDFALGVIRKADNQNPKTVTNSITGGVTWRFK